ncbi:MAG: hypothetical protein HYY25_07470 [Candidatus Wallbacteria bacterium]|nr:hypothetical protein [Candidatus Wallbacteria bacterium]
MKAAIHVFATFLVLSFGLLWQAGCNLDSGLQDPLRPRADLQVTSFSPAQITRRRVITGGVETLRSADGLSIQTRPITLDIFPQPNVTVRINNGVSALITGYSVTYNLQAPGNPPSGLPLFGGALNVFVDAAPVNSNEGLSLGNGPSGATENPLPGAPEQVAGFGNGLTTFTAAVISPEARTFLVLNSSILVANITFFVQDINGNNFTVPAAVALSGVVVVSGENVQGS